MFFVHWIRASSDQEKPEICLEIEWPEKKTANAGKFGKTKKNPGKFFQLYYYKKRNIAKSVFAPFFKEITKPFKKNIQQFTKYIS